ncbi:tyrosine-type recombinase/integrase, partial [Sphingomonas sp. BAUL-RG-20F-R05-02]|uniref:tyrosine-type recombinase/integrase n=1 Tax=Sphingomonas sp. BAUL-RG-20F-R05-02 TaxID=2914830 RepID=UPI001F56C891
MTLKYERLTREGIKRLTPGGKLTEHGITVERSAKGDLVYRINIMVDGRRIHRVIGKESDGVRREQAERAIESLRTKAREDRLDLPEGRKVAKPFLLCGQDYIARLRLEGGKSIERKERSFELHLNGFFGANPLSKISHSDLQRYRKHRLGQGASDATINRELAVVSHLFGKAVEWGWISNRPAKIPRAQESGGRIVYLTTEQCQAVLAAAQRDISPHIYAFTLIALSTSMRMSEILSIRRHDIDLPLKRIFIPLAKAGKREQPITAELARFLEGYVKRLANDSDWIFPNPASASGRLTGIRKAHRRVVKAAGLDPDIVVRHTLRHTAITHLVQAGADL